MAIDARGKSRVKVLVDPPAAPICNRCRLSSGWGQARSVDALREPFFHSSGVRAPKWTRDALELALVLLCTVRLDGRMATLRGHAAVKTALESEQTRELQHARNCQFQLELQLTVV